MSTVALAKVDAVSSSEHPPSRPEHPVAARTDRDGRDVQDGAAETAFNRDAQDMPVCVRIARTGRQVESCSSCRRPSTCSGRRHGSTELAEV